MVRNEQEVARRRGESLFQAGVRLCSRSECGRKPCGAGVRRTGDNRARFTVGTGAMQSSDSLGKELRIYYNSSRVQLKGFKQGK